jgi:hypothetical protein
MVLLPHDKESIQLVKNMLPITFFTSQLMHRGLSHFEEWNWQHIVT